MLVLLSPNRDLTVSDQTKGPTIPDKDFPPSLLWSEDSEEEDAITESGTVRNIWENNCDG